MEQVNLNTVSAVQGQELQAGGLGRLQRGMAAGAVTNMDAFAMIFQQMADGMTQNLGDGLVMGLDAEPQQEQKDGKGQDMLLNMQELAALMMQQPNLQTNVTEVSPEQAAALLAAAGSVQEATTGQVAQTVVQTTQDPTQVAQTQVAQTQVVIADGVMAAAQELPVVAGQTGKSAPTVSGQNAEGGEKQPFAADLISAEQTVERPVTRSEEGERNLFDGQNQFKNAVEEARRQLGGKTRTSEKELNAAAGADTAPKPTVLSTTTQKAEQIGQEPKLTEQLDTGIKEQLALGKNEFTLKLKPEALGEITVKLVEREGKTILTITTASAQTAKLINNDLAALREAVKPMAVEVHAAVSQPSESAQAQMQQFNMSGQQFAQQQQQHTHNSHQSNGHLNADPDLLEELETAEQVLETGRLDTYI